MCSPSDSTSLSVNSNQVIGEAAEQLAKVVLDHSTLTSFGGFPMDALRENKLTELDLSEKIWLGPTEAIVLADLIKVSAVVTSIQLDGSPLPVNALKGTRPVQTLDLSRKELGPLSAIVIAKLIEGNAFLTSLECAFLISNFSPTFSI